MCWQLCVCVVGFQSLCLQRLHSNQLRVRMPAAAAAAAVTRLQRKSSRMASTFTPQLVSENTVRSTNEDVLRKLQNLQANRNIQLPDYLPLNSLVRAMAMPLSEIKNSWSAENWTMLLKALRYTS